jgi:hypothetical protein
MGPIRILNSEFLQNSTIERRGRKGRKARQGFFAAFAAFAFHGGVGQSDTLLTSLRTDQRGQHAILIVG